MHNRTRCSRAEIPGTARTRSGPQRASMAPAVDAWVIQQPGGTRAVNMDPRFRVARSLALPGAPCRGWWISSVARGTGAIAAWVSWRCAGSAGRGSLRRRARRARPVPRCAWDCRRLPCAARARCTPRSATRGRTSADSAVRPGQSYRMVGRPDRGGRRDAGPVEGRRRQSSARQGFLTMPERCCERAGAAPSRTRHAIRVGCAASFRRRVARRAVRLVRLPIVSLCHNDAEEALWFGWPTATAFPRAWMNMRGLCWRGHPRGVLFLLEFMERRRIGGAAHAVACGAHARPPAWSISRRVASLPHRCLTSRDQHGRACAQSF